MTAHGEACRTIANASKAVISNAIAETALARFPSLSGSRCRGRASHGSSEGNAMLMSRGTTINPHQNATAPSISTRPVRSVNRQPLPTGHASSWT